MSPKPTAGDAAPPVYCCLPIEFFEPWERADAIRAVVEHKLGNSIMLQHTCHVGNSDEARAEWKRRYPQLAAKIDAVPRFPELAEHGMAALLDTGMDYWVEHLQLCRELGLKVICFFPARLNLPAEDFDRLTRAGEGVVLSESIMNENLSILGATLSLERLRQIDATPVVDHCSSYGVQAGASRASIFDQPERLDFAAVQEWFVGRFGDVGRGLRARWDGQLSAIESAPQMWLAMRAGVDIPIFELVPHDPLRGIAATRGAARAYGKNMWGVHAAMGYFRAPADAWTPERLRIAYNLFFAAGASIFTECNMPLRVTGSCAGFFSVRASPPIRAGEKERLDFDHPICAAAREVVADHFRFTQFHRRPSAHPRVRMGFLAGHLDTMTERMWFVDEPGFLAKDAVRTWRHFDRVFDAEPWYTPPRKYYWQADPSRPLRFGTPPCGQIDIVPSETPPEGLASYGCLAMLGWNTMTDDLYRRLTDYVRQGGILFLSVPHLATRTRTDQPPRFIRDGDVRELCGVRIRGGGADIEEVLYTRDAADRRCAFPRGSLYLENAKLADVELHGATPLAVSRDEARPGLPVLLEHRVGQGSVFLLNVWDYPGERLDAVITDVLRTLADSQQGDIAVRSRDVYYAVYDGAFPSGARYSVVYLVNHDIYGQPAKPTLVWSGGRETPIDVPGRGMRIVWILDGLLVSPHDRYVDVADAHATADGWRVALRAIASRPDSPAVSPRRIQVDSDADSIGSATLGSERVPIEQEDGIRLICGSLVDGESSLEIGRS